jgi:multisubunit Na+/H+ antiporter MnhG subunit
LPPVGQPAASRAHHKEAGKVTWWSIPIIVGAFIILLFLAHNNHLNLSLSALLAEVSQLIFNPVQMKSSQKNVNFM